MSILKSTRTGYKYYYIQDALQKSCDFYLNGTLLTDKKVSGTVNEDRTLSVTLPFDDFELRLYTVLMQRTIGQSPEEWFKDMPIKQFSYVGPSVNYEMVIRSPIDKDFSFKKIIGNIKIECELPNLLELFHHTEIYGTVSSSIYTQSYLNKHRICPYYGKDLMGF